MFQLVRYSRTGQLASIVALAFSLIACGSDDSDPASPLRTGVFQDSAKVEGLGYTTATKIGVTNEDGEFAYDAGESITFSLGELELPLTRAASNITPLDVFAGNEAAIADFSRLLQSMDDDGDNTNGIRIPPEVGLITEDTPLNFGTPGFDAEALAVLMQVIGPQAALVGAETAMASLNQALVDNGLVSSGDCSADHPYVGRTAEFSNEQHGVGGTITILNDCEMEVTEFNYDGGGPQVYFYAGVDRVYSSNSFIIGRQLNDTKWVNDTIRLKLPEGKSFDDFNSLSVWCAEFGINFGDAFFGDA